MLRQKPNIMTKKVNFLLPADKVGNASSVLLLGDFNHWDVQKGIKLKAQKDGTYKAVVELATGMVYQYRYLLDNGNWINDDNADGFVPVNEYGTENCIVIVHDDEIIPTLVAPTKKAATKKSAEEPTLKPSKKATKTIVEAPIEAPLADDLTKIEGIGKKIAELLTNNGFHSFELLGASTPKKIKTLLDEAGSKFKLHDPTSWPKQAKLAAAGKWDALKKLKTTLKGGK